MSTEPKFTSTPGPWWVDGPKLEGKNPHVGLWSVEGSGNVANHCTYADAHLIAATHDMFEALQRIASPDSCGCVPCVGQCTSKEALEITLDAIRDIARAALSKATSSPTKEAEGAS